MKLFDIIHLRDGWEKEFGVESLKDLYVIFSIPTTVSALSSLYTLSFLKVRVATKGTSDQLGLRGRKAALLKLVEVLALTILLGTLAEFQTNASSRVILVCSTF